MKWCITNGDLAADKLRQCLPFEVLAWRDALHEGPVQAGLSFADWSNLRADFISAAGWDEPETVRAAFAERGKKFQQALAADEITLVFEHDLYDQLQLIEVLYWLNSFRPHAKLFYAQSSTYLTELSEKELCALVSNRRFVDQSILGEGTEAFSLFAGADPRPMLESARRGYRNLPYLGRAFFRHCAEFPAPHNGLGLTDERVLYRLSESSCSFIDLFESVQAAEESRYLGDTIFEWRLKSLCSAQLIERNPETGGDHFSLTALGIEVLQGRNNALKLCCIERQLGGVPPDAARRFLFDRDKAQFLELPKCAHQG